jgi:hypothetical protein
MQEVYRMIARVVGNDLSVLVLGESGTGKELVARAIHDMGGRRKKPFVPVNMAAIPRELIEAELFGHERGAFTGANARATGRFEEANGGTLFLDEIGDMPMEAQTRLLRVLQSNAFTTVGGRTVSVDVRIVAATHQNLPSLIEAGQFREDLYYRLNVVPVLLPPLRERGGDILLLANSFLERAAADGLPRRRLSGDAEARLRAHSWPGNVRELENLMRRFCALYPEDVITARMVERELRAERVETFDNVWTGGNIKPAYPDGRPITVDPKGTDYIAGGSVGITYDTRDIVMNPTEGWFNQLTFEPAIINGNMPLVRGSGAANFFIPMPPMPWAPTERTTIAIGTRAGLIGGQVVPAYERFFSTGPFLVRGWPEFVNPTMPIVQKYGANYFQGSNAFVGSLEYRFPIFNIVSGVFFGDTGMFWDSQFKTDLLHSGYGAGLRLNTPLGPIRLDYGLSGLEPGQFHFSIGQKF